MDFFPRQEFNSCVQRYTPVNSYYKLVKKIEDNPEFDTKKAQEKLRRYVESRIC